MPKKKLPEEVETIEQVETPVEVKIEAPTLSESEQIVEWNKELAQIKADIAESRANFVKQTDSQIAQIKALEDKISSLTADYEEKKNFIELVYPAERTKFVEVQNKATSELGKLQATKDELARKEDELAKGFEKLAKQKENIDAQVEWIRVSNENLKVREKELNEIEEAQKTFKKALGIK